MKLGWNQNTWKKELQEQQLTLGSRSRKRDSQFSKRGRQNSSFILFFSPFSVIPKQSQSSNRRSYNPTRLGETPGTFLSLPYCYLALNTHTVTASTEQGKWTLNFPVREPPRGALANQKVSEKSQKGKSSEEQSNAYFYKFLSSSLGSTCTDHT